jgi:tetratricopeptide (TPR) repeat protein
VRRIAATVLGITLLACAGRAPRPAPPPPLPQAAYAHYLRGRVAVTEGDHALAVQELRAAAAAAPGEVEITVALVDALLRAERPFEATIAARAAQKRWPRQSSVWLISGHVHLATDDSAGAGAAFERAIDLDRRAEAAYLGLAATWLDRERPDRAERAWRQLLAAVPGSIEGHYRLAARLLRRGAYREADPHLIEVLELSPDHIDARLDLARSLRLQGRRRDAVAATREAFDRAGNTADVGEELYWLLCEVGDRRAALDLLGLLDDPGASAETRLALARLYLGAGDLARARAVATAALTAAPASGDARLALARVDRARGDTDRAIAGALAIPTSSPALARARALAAELLIERGDTDRAIAAIESARALHPHDPGLIHGHALALARAGRTDDARRVVEAELRARPGDLGILYAAARFDDDTGRPEQAIAALDRILAARPDDVATLNFAGYSRADRGRDLDRATRLLSRARQLAPGDPDVLDSWGWLLHRRGRHREAAAALARAAQIAPREPEILVHLGEVWAALGDRGQARVVLERARALAPPARLRARIEARLTAIRAGR